VVEFRNFWRLGTGTTEELAELVPFYTLTVSFIRTRAVVHRDVGNYTELGDGIVKMTDAVTDYLSWCGVHGYSKATLRARRYYLASFLSFLDERELFDVESVTASVLDSYQPTLPPEEDKRLPLSFRTQANGSSL